MRIRNFGKNVSFSPARVLYPETTAELQQHVRSAAKVRVMGARHSWSRGIVTDDTLLSLDRMRRVLEIDPTAKTITAQAGIRLEELVSALEKRGLALANLGSIASQSIAGAIATGTHGTGLEFQCLANQIVKLKLIDGAGEERVLDREHPHFDAVCVGLGCFGIVHEVTLAVVDSFQLHFVTDMRSFDDVIENLDDYVRGHDHFKFWWLVPEDRVIVFEQDRTHEPRNDSDLQRWFKDDVLAGVVFRTCLALERIERKRLVPTVNKILGGEVGRHHDRICKSHVGFLTPKPPVHRECEWAFDYAHAPTLLREYRDLLIHSGHTYNFVQEIRFTKADDFWLSPGFGRDSIWLSLYNADKESRWNEQLGFFKEFASRHEGRPHWGKEGIPNISYLRQQWPHFEEFAALTHEYDPKGLFANDWIRDVLGR